jgi:hypothetical protein
MGYKGKLIASGSNAKTVKGDAVLEYETAIMYLAPFTSAGMGNVCPMAETAKCVEGCLNTAGRASMFASIPEARKRKTLMYMNNRAEFLHMLACDLERFVSWCEKRGRLPAVRLNGTSDIQWERGHPVERGGVRYNSIMAAFPEVQFYDYTKIVKRVERGNLPSNYALTVSYSGANGAYAHTVRMAALAGNNVAVVFRNKARVKQAIAEGFMGASVIDGDTTDARFLDPQGGYVVALYAKGKAKLDQSGFVVD